MDAFETPSQGSSTDPNREPTQGPAGTPAPEPTHETIGQPAGATSAPSPETHERYGAGWSHETSAAYGHNPGIPAPQPAYAAPGVATRQARPTGWQRIAVPLIAALIGSAIGSGATLASQGTASNSASQPSTVVRQVSQGSEPLTGVAGVANQVLPSVVQIDVKSRVTRFFGNYVTSATGSGVIYRSDGYILTNRHVVEGADSIDVTFSDGSKASASLVGTTDNGDIGVIKVDKTGLKAATFGSSTGLHVGDVAVAIGSPFGLEGTVTSGVVSALHRSIDEDNGVTLDNVLQTDAPINPGNSGGALADANGDVVGINTAIVGSRDGSVGVGFAIPVDVALAQARQIIGSAT